MGPASETFLTILIPVALVAALLGYAMRQPARRVARYLRAWQQRDEVDEACRDQALREMHPTGIAEEPESKHEQNQV